MDWFLALLAGLGIGSLLKSIADHFMSRRAASRDCWYQEKREAYLGLLSALHAAAVSPSPSASKDYALWQTRCELFGSANVTRFAQDIVNTNIGPVEDRVRAFRRLVAAMREDLRS